MFWFIYGLLVGAGAMRLFIWINQGLVTVPWYGWAVGIITFLLVTLVIDTFFGSFREREPKAAWMSLLFLGIPTLVFATITIMTVRWV
jgi:hypothetical protein